MKKAIIGTVAGISIAVAGGVTTLFASSHREAPAIAEDQFADNTDVYTFISPTDPDRLVIVANYVPLLLGPSGPNFYKFSDQVRYAIPVDTAPVAPCNVGKASFSNYEQVALRAVQSGANNIKSFAGPRDEPFFVDLH